MRNTLALTSLALLAASGCVTYDNEKGGDYDTASFHEDPSDGDITNGGDVTDDGDGDGDQVDPADALTFAPSKAEQGDIFAGVISAGEGFEMDRVDDVYLLGDLEILNFQVHGDTIVATLSVDDDADTGEIALAIVMDDQTTYWLEGALTIYEAGSGNSTAGSSAECP